MSRRVTRQIISDGSGGGSFDDTAHALVRQLIHLANNGPMEHWASGAYRETLPLAAAFPTSFIWYEDATKAKKIVAKLVTFDAQHRVTAIQWSAYDTDGTTVLAQVIDTISYSGPFETGRTRTIL